jgi:hypothetical protein
MSQIQTTEQQLKAQAEGGVSVEVCYLIFPSTLPRIFVFSSSTNAMGVC